MRKSQAWFEVDKDGLAGVQGGKPLHYIAREAVANCFDQKASYCRVDIRHGGRSIELTVEDDDPEGFEDLKDAYTLFKSTKKRSDATVRGRWNAGEKQAFSRCSLARIITTKGSVIFDAHGRRPGTKKRSAGSHVYMKFKGTKKDAQEIERVLLTYIPPKSIRYTVNGVERPTPEPTKVLEAALQTELSDTATASLRRTTRKTQIHVFENTGGTTSMLYELGIPVCEIDCKYSLDVQQKVPLGIDRETVPEAFLRDLYAEVLNATASDLKPEQSSETWVRLASEDERISDDAWRKVSKARWGDKVAVANPNDPRSNDEAVSKGYRLVHGSELSGAEWKRVRAAGVLSSTTKLFGLTPGQSKPVQPTPAMLKVAALAKAIAMRVCGFEITVGFIELPNSRGFAWYGGRHIDFVVNKLGKAWFDDALADKVISLILHELAHDGGHLHTQHGFHEAICDMAAKLVRIARKEPTWFLEVTSLPTGA